MIRTVQTDPPWLERGGGKIKRGADRHYPLMKKEDILKTILQSEHWNDVGPDAHLYMWVTNNFLKDGLWLMEALDFRYVTNICWVKVKEDWPDIFDQLLDKEGNLQLNPLTWMKVLKEALRIGLGQYFRGSHELCLFGVRGECTKPAKAHPSVFHAARGEHSAKPTRIYEIIESSSPGDYLEIFARSRRKGWTSWGNEVPQDLVRSEGEELPNNFLPDGYTEGDECPNCQSGTVEHQVDGLYACRGECGALFQGPRR